MTSRMEKIIDEAVAQGIVDGALFEAEKREHPWPVIIMTAVMTVLASIPITGVLFLLFADGPGKSNAVYLGLVVVACVVPMLRATPIPLFLEYLSVSLIGSGLCLMLIENHRSAPIALTGLLSLALTVVVSQAWIRALLAAVSVQLLLYALTQINAFMWSADRLLLWSGCHVAVLGWLGTNLLMQRTADAGHFARAAWLESVLLGSAIALLGYWPTCPVRRSWSVVF